MALREFEFDGPKEHPVDVYFNGRKYVGYEMVIISSTKKYLARSEWEAIMDKVLRPELEGVPYYFDPSIGSLLVSDRNAAVKLKLKFG